MVSAGHGALHSSEVKVCVIQLMPICQSVVENDGGACRNRLNEATGGGIAARHAAIGRTVGAARPISRRAHAGSKWVPLSGLLAFAGARIEMPPVASGPGKTNWPNCEGHLGTERDDGIESRHRPRYQSGQGPAASSRSSRAVSSSSGHPRQKPVGAPWPFRRASYPS
jgi:hypothetical protein